MNNKGFTLIEMVVAIGILMIASSFVLQVFMTARGVNDKAYNLDYSVNLTTRVLESLKTPQGEGSQPFKDLMSLAALEKSGTTATYTSFYDKEWRPVAATSKVWAFTLQCQVDKAPKGYANVTLTVHQKKDDKPQKVLYTLEGAVLKED